MSYIDQNLVGGETVLYRTRLHWIVVFWPCALAAVVGAAGLFAAFEAVADLNEKNSSSGTIAIFALCLIIAAALLLGFGVVRRNATEMAITNKRVIVKVGVVTNKIVELFLTRIESVVVDQTVWGRILGYGSIVVRGTGGTAEPFSRVAHPLEFRRQVQQQIEASQGQTRSASGSPML